jgi:hypothetical protein
VISVGIDNGVTGSLAVVKDGNLVLFAKTPTIKVPHYGKGKGKFQRVDAPRLRDLLFPFSSCNVLRIERPMINPGRFAASVSAARAFEATLIVLEDLGMCAPTVVDSKAWQKKWLGACEDLKAESRLLAVSLFPKWEATITKHGDGDAVFLALG